MQTLILSVLCVGLVLSGTVDPEIKSKLDSITQNQFGKTLFDTIQVELQGSEPLDKLLDTLANVEQQYQRDQREDDQTNQKFQAQCDTDLASLEQELAVTERKKVELQGVIDELKPVLQQRQGQLTAKKELRTNLQAEMDGLDVQRQQEAEEFEQKRQEMQLVVSVIQEAKKIFQSNFGGSFLQASKPTTQIQPEIMTQINSHFNKIAQQTGKQKFGKTFSHIFKFLATMTSNNQAGNAQLVEKILKLCDQLLQKVDESWNLERRAEDQRVTVYNNYKKLLQKDMNQYNTQIANLETEIATLTDKLNATNNSLDDTNQRYNDKDTRRNDRRQECTEAAYDYAQRRKQRDGDREVASNLIGIVHANLRDLKEYIALRIAAGDTRLQ